MLGNIETVNKSDIWTFKFFFSNSKLPCVITFFHILCMLGFLMIRYRFFMITKCMLQILYDKCYRFFYALKRVNDDLQLQMQIWTACSPISCVLINNMMCIVNSIRFITNLLIIIIVIHVEPSKITKP